VTSQFSSTVNWAKGLNEKGQPVRDPGQGSSRRRLAGLVGQRRRHQLAAAAFSPDTGLLYVPVAENYAMYYLTELDPRGAMGLGGKEEVGVGGLGSYIAAIDYKTGKSVWKHQFRTASGDSRGGPGLLVTAGRLLFGGDISGNFIAFDPATGKPLWHSRIGNVTNAPETYLVDGRQHVLVAAGDTLYSFALY
jgi:alcohol dehydrogenase (cytochrome c)